MQPINYIIMVFTPTERHNWPGTRVTFNEACMALKRHREV